MTVQLTEKIPVVTIKDAGARLRQNVVIEVFLLLHKTG